MRAMRSVRRSHRDSKRAKRLGELGIPRLRSERTIILREEGDVWLSHALDRATDG